MTALFVFWSKQDGVQREVRRDELIVLHRARADAQTSVAGACRGRNVLRVALSVGGRRMLDRPDLKFVELAL